VLELLAVPVLMPPAPPDPVAVLLLVPLIPPAPPAPPAPLLELDPLLDDALLEPEPELDPLLDEEPVLMPPSGVYGVQGTPASVTPQIAGALHCFDIGSHLALQQSASFAQVIPAMPQRLKVCAPAMQMPVVEGSVRSTIVALNAFGSWHR
jgi:hypothetical protein